MVNEIKISVRSYAKQLNVDEKAVRKAIDAGIIKKGYDKKTKKIIASVADKEWGFKHKVPRPQRGLSAAKVADKIEKQHIEINSNESPDDNDDVGDKNYSYAELIEGIKITPTLKYQEALRRKEILSIAREKMELEELDGSLLKKVDVDKALFSVGDQLKKDLLNIPAAIIDEVMSAPTKVEGINIMITEINRSLNRINKLLPQ